MHAIEKHDYGYLLVFGGFMDEAEMKAWVAESREALAKAPKSFGVMVDMRTLKPLTDAAQAAMVEGQKLYKEKGMQRSAVALASSVVTMQFRRLAEESGIYAWERYLDASKVSDWEKVGKEWITSAKDPDKRS